MPKDSFLGTSLCGGPLGLCPGETAETPAGSEPGAGPGGAADVGKKKKKLSGGAIAGIAIGCVFGVLLLLALIFFLCRKKSSGARSTAAVEKGRGLDMASLDAEPKGQNGSAAGNGMNGAAAGAVPAAAAAVAAAKSGGSTAGSKKLIYFGPMAAAPPFDLEDLLRASAEVLGKGAFGTAYKAVMESGAAVAVKRLKDVDLPEPEFRERIAAIGAVQHELVVPLRAYYFSKDEKLLVYDYMSMGSLSALLHGKNTNLQPSFLPPLQKASRRASSLSALCRPVGGWIDPNSLAIFRRRREKSPQPHGGASLSRPDPSISFTIFTRGTINWGHSWLTYPASPLARFLYWGVAGPAQGLRHGKGC
jgi:hypothetical protein